MSIIITYHNLQQQKTTTNNEQQPTTNNSSGNNKNRENWSALKKKYIKHYKTCPNCFFLHKNAATWLASCASHRLNCKGLSVLKEVSVSVNMTQMGQQRCNSCAEDTWRNAILSLDMFLGTLSLDMQNQLLWKVDFTDCVGFTMVLISKEWMDGPNLRATNQGTPSTSQLGHRTQPRCPE